MTDRDQDSHPASSPPHQNKSDTADDDHGSDRIVTGGEPSPLCYSDHIAKVCEAVNSEKNLVHQPHNMSQTDADRRRMANRITARRRRQRKKGELEQKALDFQRLSRENESLTAEKARLQQELLQEEALCREWIIASSVPRVSVERLTQTHMIVPHTQATLPQQPRHPTDLIYGGFATSSGRISNLPPSMYQGTDPFAQLRMSGFQRSDAEHNANSALLEAVRLESLQALLLTSPSLLAQTEAPLTPSVGRLGYQTNGMNHSFTDPALYLQWLQATSQPSISSLLQSTQPVLTASTFADVQQYPDRSVLG